MALARRPMMVGRARCGQAGSRGTGTFGTLPKGMCPVLSPYPVSMDGRTNGTMSPNVPQCPVVSRTSKRGWDDLKLEQRPLIFESSGLGEGLRRLLGSHRLASRRSASPGRDENQLLVWRLVRSDPISSASRTTSTAYRWSDTGLLIRYCCQDGRWSSDRAGISRVGLPHSKTYLGRESARGVPGQRRGLRLRQGWQNVGPSTGGGTGVEAISAALAIIDLFPIFRGFVVPILRQRCIRC
jgi:hypothetical protein